MSATLTTQGSTRLDVMFDASFSTAAVNNGGGEFQLLVDGVAKRGTVGGAGAATNLAPGFTAALTFVTAVLAAGSHTITIQWASAVGGSSVSIRPNTTILEHASLVVQEIH